MIYLSTLLLALFVTIPLIPVSIRLAEKLGVMDVPGERKVHARPIARTGGLAMVVGTFAAALFLATPSLFLRAYTIGVAVIVVFGLLDDVRNLGYVAKFAGQTVAALVIVLYGGLRIENLGSILPDGMMLPAWISIPFTVIVIVGVTNAVNLSDGLDGLAGGISILGFCCIAYLAYLVEDTVGALLATALMGAVFGFLRFNTFPASVFMGDTGSQFLGFSLVTLSLDLTQDNTALSPVLPLLIFGFPVLDTVAVMAERIADGVSPFAADKRHFHHRLMRVGFYHTESVFLIYVINAVFVSAAFFLRYHNEWLIVVGYAVFSAMIVGGFYVAAIRDWKVRRTDLIDRVVKGRLKTLKEKGFFIMVSFRAIEWGLPLFLVASSLLPSKVPNYFSYACAGLMAIIAFTWFFRRSFLRVVLTLSLYVCIPFVMYFGALGQEIRISGNLLRIYNISLLVFVFFAIMTLKMTKRRKGFRATPMDFLILFIALVAPYVAGTYEEYKELGIVAAQSVALFFSFEVLMGEVRGEYGRLTIASLVTLAVIAIRPVLSF